MMHPILRGVWVPTYSRGVWHKLMTYSGKSEIEEVWFIGRNPWLKVVCHLRFVCLQGKALPPAWSGWRQAERCIVREKENTNSLDN